ncbi:MAG: RNA methyltransferase [Solobacterium sp.]|nr:RNA methyltransferase [Solobacterium sp.]
MNSEFSAAMRRMLKEEYAAYEAALSRKPERGFRINTLKIDQETFLKNCAWEYEKSPYAANGYYLKTEITAGTDPAWHAGLYYMQEPSASAAVTVMAPRIGAKVLDLCAAPGSKSTQIAEMLGNDGLLVVNEINPKRAQILLENIIRHGCTNAVVLNASPRDIAANMPGVFDYVLCDAPCSGEGMFRKEEEALRQWSPSLVAQCASVQKEILPYACQCLKPGGILLYSTCTFNLEENEKQIAGLLEEHSEMGVDMAETYPFGRRGFACGHETEKAVRIFPMDRGEGHFIIRLRKSDGVAGYLKLMKSDPLAKAVVREIEAMLKEPFPYYFRHGEKLYGGTSPFVDCGRVRLLRHQVLLGEMKKNGFVPDHHLFMTGRFARTENLDDEEVRLVLRGHELPRAAERGWTALTWHDAVIAGAKADGKMLKNKYPASLRMRKQDESL